MSLQCRPKPRPRPISYFFILVTSLRPFLNQSLFKSWSQGSCWWHYIDSRFNKLVKLDQAKFIVMIFLLHRFFIEIIQESLVTWQKSLLTKCGVKIETMRCRLGCEKQVENLHNINIGDIFTMQHLEWLAKATNSSLYFRATNFFEANKGLIIIRTFYFNGARSTHFLNT